MATSERTLRRQRLRYLQTALMELGNPVHLDTLRELGDDADVRQFAKHLSRALEELREIITNQGEAHG